METVASEFERQTAPLTLAEIEPLDKPLCPNDTVWDTMLRFVVDKKYSVASRLSILKWVWRMLRSGRRSDSIPPSRPVSLRPSQTTPAAFHEYDRTDLAPSCAGQTVARQ